MEQTTNTPEGLTPSSATVIHNIDADLALRGELFDPLNASAQRRTFIDSCMLVVTGMADKQAEKPGVETPIERCERLIRSIITDEALAGFLANLEGAPRDSHVPGDRWDKLRWLAGWDYAETLIDLDSVVDDMKFIMRHFITFNEHFRKTNGVDLSRTVILHSFGSVITHLEDMGYEWRA